MTGQIHRFFEERPGSVGENFTLTEPNARNVLRLSRGDRIVLLDGRGGVATGEILEVGKARVTATILDRREVAPPIPAITLLQGFPKGEKSSWVVQKSVEFGARRVVFFESGRTIGKKSTGQTERWRRVAIEAIRQSGNPHLPSIEGPVALGDVPQDSRSADVALLLDEAERTRTFRDLIGIDSPSSVCVAVGPEGGWSDDDRSILRKAGFEPITVGPFTLRTETAALAALAAVRALWPGFR